MKLIQALSTVVALLAVSAGAQQVQLPTGALNVQDAANNPVGTVATTATQLQLLILGISPKTADEWIAWYQDTRAKLLDNGLNINAIIADRTVAPLAGVIVVALLAAILIPIGGCLFCCCRVRDGCGGRRPRASGYSTKQLLFSAFQFFSYASILIAFYPFINYSAFSALIMVFSGHLTKSVGSVRTGTLQLLTDTATFATKLQQGISESPNVLKNELDLIVGNITSLDIGGELNKTFSVPVNSVFTRLIDMDAKLTLAKNNLSLSSSLVTKIKSELTLIPTLLANISVQMNILKQVQIDGVPYNVTGFPASATIDSNALPAANSVPSLAGYIADMNALPNLTDQAYSTRSTFQSLTANLSAQLNSTIKDAVPNTTSLSSGLVDTANSGLSPISSTIDSAKTTIGNAFNLYTQYDMYRNDAMVIEAGLIIGFAGMAVLGMFIIKHKLMFCFPVFAMLITFFIWIQFLIFYMIGMPINVGCNSLAAVKSAELTMSSFTIKPSAILDGCGSSGNIFDANLISVVESLIRNLLKVDELLSNSTVSGWNTIPNPSNQSDSIADVDLGGLNTTALDLVQSYGFNLTSLSNQMNDAVASLSAASFDPDFGNLTTRAEKLQDFNTYAASIQGGFTGWTVSYITTTYITNGQTFQPTDVKANPSGTESSNLNSKFNAAYVRIRFVEFANETIASLQLNVTNLRTSIASLESDHITVLKNDSSVIRNRLNDIQVSINATTSGLALLKIDVNSFSAASESFKNWTISNVKAIFSSGITTLVNKLFLNNPVAGFGSCALMANDVKFMEAAVCTSFNETLAGLWFCYLIIAIFLFFGFISAMKTKKRIEYLERRATNVKNYGKVAPAQGYMQSQRAAYMA